MVFCQKGTPELGRALAAQGGSKQDPVAAAGMETSVWKWDNSFPEHHTRMAALGMQQWTHIAPDTPESGSCHDCSADKPRWMLKQEHQPVPKRHSQQVQDTEVTSSWLCLQQLIKTHQNHVPLC